VKFTTLRLTTIFHRRMTLCFTHMKRNNGILISVMLKFLYMSLCCQFVSNLNLGHCKFRSVLFTLLLDGKQIFLVSIDLLTSACLQHIDLSHYLTKLMYNICFTISFISCLYMFRAHVLETCRGMK